MDLTFTNGTAEQHQICRQAFADLLNLDLDRFDFSCVIDFRANPVSDPFVHHPFAVTESFTDHEEIHIREDFPHFSVDSPELAGYGSVRFAKETAAHELGHAILHQLPDLNQGKIAAMFGTTPATMNPTNVGWEDRPEEGIAETFKDAFLPQAQREFANRTHEKIAIPKYPHFRRLWRDGSVVPDVGSPGLNFSASDLGLPDAPAADPALGIVNADDVLADMGYFWTPARLPFGYPVEPWSGIDTPGPGDINHGLRQYAHDFNALDQATIEAILADRDFTTIDVDTTWDVEPGQTPEWEDTYPGIDADSGHTVFGQWLTDIGSPPSGGDTFVSDFSVVMRLIWLLEDDTIVHTGAGVAFQRFTYHYGGLGWLPSGGFSGSSTVPHTIPVQGAGLPPYSADARTLLGVLTSLLDTKWLYWKNGGNAGLQKGPTEGDPPEGGSVLYPVRKTAVGNFTAEFSISLPDTTEPGEPLDPQADPPNGLMVPGLMASGRKPSGRQVSGSHIG